MTDKFDIELIYCDWCHRLMSYDEIPTSEVIYTGEGGATLHLCFVDREFVTTENLAVDGQLVIDQASRDAAFAAYIANAINPELSDIFGYPWY